MAESAKRSNLGRGLSALLGDDAEPDAAPSTAAAAGALEVAITGLRPNHYQPRQIFNAAELSELTESIREKGILQPILVRPTGDAETPYEIIAGERRWRAAQQAQLHQVPVIVRELGDEEALEWALIENLQREDLSALEEAEGYRRLMDEFSHTQEQLAKALGKSRSHVANTIRLLNLPDAVKGMLREGDLSPGHARALLKAGDPVKLAKSVIRRGLNVRQTEKLAQGAGPSGSAAKNKSQSAAQDDPNTRALENDVSSLLGLGVKIDFRGESGSITITYDTLEQLDEILHRLSQGAHGHSIARDEREVLDEISPDEAGSAAAEDLADLLPEDADDVLAQIEEGITAEPEPEPGAAAATDGEVSDLSLNEDELGDLIEEVAGEDEDEDEPAAGGRKSPGA